MTQENQNGESFRSLALASIRSTSFWSFVAGIVGVMALLAGGAVFFTVEELRDFAVSVLLIGIVLVFLALVISPRAVAIFLVGRQGKYGSNVVIMTIAFFAIVIVLNFLLFRSPTRIDVTATRVLTLADQTLEKLDSLDTEVLASAFFTPSSATNAAARQQAEDLLNEFERHGSKFTYRFVDPELQKAIADNYEVASYPAIVFEDQATERRQTVTDFNEQEFVTGILVATGVAQKRVYILTGHSEAAATIDPITGEVDKDGLDYALDGMRRDNYEVLSLNLKQFSDVPEDTAVLVIAGPGQNLDLDESEALLRYIKRGGRILAMLDPDTPLSFAEIPLNWGIGISEDSVADVVSNVSGQILTPLVQRANSQYITSAVTGVPIVDKLDVTFFADAAAIMPVMSIDELPPLIRLSPLAVTTPASWLETNAEEIGFTPGEETLDRYTLAAVIEAGQTLDESEVHPLAKFVIIGDSDFATNKFFFSNDNANLVLNSVNWLAEDYELIGIRPKLFPFRPLVINTRERDFIRFSSWVVPPLIMLILGGYVWWRRR